MTCARLLRLLNQTSTRDDSNTQHRAQETQVRVDTIAEHMDVRPRVIAGWVQQLADDGVSIRFIDGDTRLAFSDLPRPLSQQLIEAALAPMRVTVESYLSSTNQFIVDTLNYPESVELSSVGWLVATEVQSAGKGTRGRVWSACGWRNLFLSIARPVSVNPVALTGLSLAVGVGVATTLNDRLGVGARLKWPNDVLINGRKVAGILVELVPVTDEVVWVVVGVGVNVDFDGRVPSTSGFFTPVDLAAACGVVDRQTLLIALARHVNAVIEKFPTTGFSGWQCQYAALDALTGRRLVLQLPRRVITGRCAGVNSEGGLVISGPNGDEVVVSGSVSRWCGD